MNRNPVYQEIALYANLMYEKNYTSGQEGNISYRLAQNRIAITPSNLIKKLVKPRDIVEINLQGDLVRGSRKASTEKWTHLEIYKNNPEVLAVVHAHPFFTVLSTVIQKNPFEAVFLSEAVMFLRDVCFVPYAKPSTPEGAEKIREFCKTKNALVIDRHGSFTYGKDLQSAFALTELLEKYCKMFYFAALSGEKIKFLTPDEIEDLKKIPY